MTPRHHDNSASDVPLWREADSDWLHTLDGRLSSVASSVESIIAGSAIML
jgi:hypothetical protein